MPWTPSGIVTLLTDFGLRDSYVGTMRAVLLSRCPELRHIVDLTHGIPPQDVVAGAYQWAQAWSYFPSGTVHVAVVDPGVGSDRRALVAGDAGHAFIAPDNGLLAAVLGEEARVFEIDLERLSLPVVSRTFHGRDVFAPAAAALAGGTPPEQLGAEVSFSGRSPLPKFKRDEATGALTGEIQSVDHFGNLISSLPVDALAGADSRIGWHLSVCGRTVSLVGTYSEAEPGEPLALVNSAGFLEIAIRGGSAATFFNCGVGEPIKMEISR